MVKKIILILVLITMVFWFSGCQTVAGIGGDIKWTAEATANLLEGN